MTLVLTDDDRDFLQHYGVKGMKWGVRRSQGQLDRNSGRPPKKTRRQRRRENNKNNADYKKDQREFDRTAFGRGGEKRINRRMNKGRSRRTAQVIEAGQLLVKTTLIYTAANVVAADLATGGGISKTVGNRLKGKAMDAAQAQAKKRAGQNAVNALTTNATLPFARKRRGAYNITSM